ncbi:MAG: hypothetical protein FWE70_01100 [Oscillospiraceae bacterium]|nr:hypothetical protein [Oscillospiraceae bacterium]
MNAKRAITLPVAILSLIAIFFALGCSPTDGSVDIDLTALSGTLTYAKVYDMMNNPSGYLGKTVKASGPYVTSDYGGGLYHFVLVEGIDSCCPEGLMFIWDGDHPYPESYPEEMTEIEIVGVFRSYGGFDFEYYYFDVGELSVLG